MAKARSILGYCAATAILTTTFIAAPRFIVNKEIGYTGAEIVYNAEYLSNLDDLKTTNDITFNNYDLYTSIASQISGDFTVHKLREIKKLRIDLNVFSNKDLSDLKYFTNLEHLEIANGTINCTDLKYNQKLSYASFTYCDVSKTSELPNSIAILDFNNCHVIDAIVRVPYDTKSLSLINSTSNKVSFKNPEKLEDFTFNGYSFLDLADFEQCINLQHMTLKQCPNVYHPESLSNIKKLQTELDEFCCVWGYPNFVSDLPREYKSIMLKLDDIAASTTTDDMNDKEKIEHITLYTLSQIEYDFSSLGQSSGAQLMLSEYNSRPLTYALNSKRGVCVSYATFFKAIANRAKLDSYQPDSINHTWNMVKKQGEAEYMAYDLTQLDNPNAVIGTFENTIVDETSRTQDYINSNRSNELLFFGFDYREANDANFSYNTFVEPVNVKETDTNIGYVNVDSPARHYETNRLRFQIALSELGIMAILNYLYESIKNHNKSRKKYDKRQEKVYTKAIN